MSAGTWGQLTVVAILLFAFPIYRVGRPWYVRLRLRRLIRNWNRSRRQHDEPLAYAMERDRMVGRQREMLKLADSIAESPDRERLRMMAEAEALDDTWDAA